MSETPSIHSSIRARAKSTVDARVAWDLSTVMGAWHFLRPWSASPAMLYRFQRFEDDGVPEADEVLPGRGKDMVGGVIGQNGGKTGDVELE